MNKIRLLETFSDLVSIYSPSLSERLVCDYLSSKLSELGFRLHEDWRKYWKLIWIFTRR